jgi:hypothetical protein
MGVYKLSSAGGLATPRTNYSSFLAGNPTFIPTSYDSIATVTVGSGGTSTISFSSIPSTFTHLQVRYSTLANTGSNLDLRFNSDTTNSNYMSHRITGYGYAIDTDGSARPIIGAADTNPASGIIDILDYKNTNKYKTSRALTGLDGNGGTCRLRLASVLWINTNAISSIEIICDGTITQYSQFALYGVKG